MLKVLTPAEAAAMVKSGQTVMIGGFLANGTPHAILEALLAGSVDDLTVIANDTSYPESGIGKLVVAGRIKKAIVSHVGTNPITGQKMNSGEMEVDLVPQGTLAERIRAAGAGLGGVLTPTGVGTTVEEGKHTHVINGKTYLLETALPAQVALIKAKKADMAGNLIYSHSARNFNPLMASAAELVIVEAEEIVETGAIDPDQVHTPGIFVDYLVKQS